MQRQNFNSKFRNFTDITSLAGCVIYVSLRWLVYMYSDQCHGHTPTLCDCDACKGNLGLICSLGNLGLICSLDPAYGCFNNFVLL